MFVRTLIFGFLGESETDYFAISPLIRFFIDTLPNVYWYMYKKYITLCGDLSLLFPSCILCQIENENQKSQITGKDYIYTCTVIVFFSVSTLSYFKERDGY